MRSRRHWLVLGCFALTPLLVSASRATAQEFSQELVKKAEAATLFLNGSWGQQGTAFRYSELGLFLSNQHVINLSGRGPGDEFTLVAFSGTPQQKLVKVRLLNASPYYDLAVFEAVDRKQIRDIPTLPLAEDLDLNKMSLLTPVMACGFPLGNQMIGVVGGELPSVSINTGQVNAFRREGDRHLGLQINIPFVPGNSGGPVINGQGKVVGIAHSTIGGRISYAISSMVAHRFLRTPGVKLNREIFEMNWRQRHDEVPFELSFLTTHCKQQPTKVELLIRAFKEEEPRSYFADLSDDGTKAKLTATVYPPSLKEQPLPLVLRRGSKESNNDMTKTNVVDADLFKFQDKTYRISDIAYMERVQNDRFYILTKDIQKTVIGLDDSLITEDEQAQILPEKKWQRMLPHVDDEHLGSAELVVRSYHEDELLGETSGLLELRNRPPMIGYGGDPPNLVDGEPLKRIRVELTVDQQAKLRIGKFNGISDALEISYTNGSSPGYRSLLGPYVLVNDQVWHAFYMLDPRTGKPTYDPPRLAPQNRTYFISQPLPLKLSKGKWECEVKRIWSAGQAKEGEGIKISNLTEGLLIELDTPERKRAHYVVMFRAQ